MSVSESGDEHNVTIRRIRSGNNLPDQIFSVDQNFRDRAIRILTDT